MKPITPDFDTSKEEGESDGEPSVMQPSPLQPSLLPPPPSLQQLSPQQPSPEPSPIGNQPIIATGNTPDNLNNPPPLPMNSDDQGALPPLPRPTDKDEDQIEMIFEDINGNTNQINVISDRVKELENRLTDLEDTVSDIEDEVKQLEKKIGKWKFIMFLLTGTLGINGLSVLLQHCVKSVQIQSFFCLMFFRTWGEYGPEKIIWALRIWKLFT